MTVLCKRQREGDCILEQENKSCIEGTVEEIIFQEMRVMDIQ